LKLPNTVVPEFETRSHPAQVASTYVTVAAVSWIKDSSRSCHAEEFLLESSRCLGKSYDNKTTNQTFKKKNKTKQNNQMKKKVYSEIISPVCPSNFPVLIVQDFLKQLCPCI